MTIVLLGVIFDIHRVCTNLEDPVDVRNDPSKAPVLKTLLLQIFLCGLELSFALSFEKTSSAEFSLFYLLLKCSHGTSESFCKVQIFGQPRVRGGCMYSEALDKDGHEYDKGDA